MPAKPNVLFILSDQHNAKFMSCTGMIPNIRTPNFDRLAAEGVRFENAVTQITICTPSRVCFMSGQYSHNHGRYGFGGPKPEAPTLLGHFRAAGYHTACVGKMHCPAYWLEDDSDEFYETDRTSVGGSCQEYLDYMDRKKGPLFQGQRGPLTPQGLQLIWKSAVKKAELPAELSIHSARHSIAVHLLKKTGNLRQVQKQLGHSSPATTANMYADVTFEDMQDGLNGLYE